MALNIKINKSAYSSHFIACFHILLQIIFIFIPSLLFTSITKYNFLFYMVSIIFIGTRMRALGNIMHECSHNSYAPSKRGNKIFGNLISILDFSSFHEYKKSHALHHRYLGDEKKDDDYIKFLKLVSFYKNKKIVNNIFILFCFVILNPFNWIIYFRSNFCFFEKNKFIILFKLFYLILLTVIFFFNVEKFTLFFILPYFTTFQMLKIFSDFFDHHETYLSKNMNLNIRNHIFKSRILNLIFFPRNDCYHLLHHIIPRAPITQFKQIHNFLLKNDVAYRKQNW